MKKFLKWTLGGVGVIVLLLIVAVIAIPLLFDPNAHKPRIESLVKSEIGRELSIQGDISLSLFPWLGFKVGKLTLGNAPGFDDASFASVDNVEIRVRLLPLLEKEVEMDTVAVDGLTLNLTRTAAGKNNWEDLAAAGQKPGAESRSGPPPIAALAIGGINLSNASVAVDDAQSGQRASLSNLKLITGPLTPGRPVEVSAEFDFAASQPDAAGRVGLSARIFPDLVAQRFSAENLQLSVALSGKAIPGGNAKLEAKGNVTFDQVSQRLLLSGFEIRSDNPAVPGLNGSVVLAGDFSADLASRDGGAKRYTAERFQFNAALSGEAIPGGKASLEAKGNAMFDEASQRLVLNGLELKSDNPGVPGLNGNVVMTGDIGADLASRDVSAGNFSLKGDVAGLVPEGKARFELRGNARANLDSLALTAPDLVLQADGLAMQGVNGSLKASLGLAGNIEQRRFDLSALKASGKFQGSALPLKGEVPLTFSAGSAALDLSKGNATLNAFDLNIQSLRSSGSVTATALLSKPRFSGQLEIAPFNLRALLTSLNQPVPNTTDARVLTTASLSTQFKSDLKTVTLDKLRMKLDDTSLAGSVIAGLEKDAPLRLDLSLDTLDADRYLPPQSAKPAATPASAAATAITLPVEQLRALDIEARVRAGKLKVTGLRLEDVDVGVSAKRGKIHLSPLKTALYGGRYTGDLQLDVSSATPKLSLDERVSGLRVDALLKDLQIAPGGMDFSGGVSDLRLRGEASGDVAQNTFQFKDLSLNASLGGKSFPGGKLAFDVQTDADVDLGKQTLSARPLQLKFGPLVAKGQLGLTQLLSAPKYAAKIEVPAFNARALLATLGQPAPDTADPKALTSVALSTTATGSAADVNLDPLTINLDGTRLQGNLAMSNLQAPLPAARFDLKADQLDADRYLPPTGGKAKVGTPGAAATAIPVDTLRALDLDGRIGVGELKIANLRLQNVVLVAKGKDGRLQLSPLNAQLYQGTYAGNIVIDASGKQPPRLSLNEKLTGVQAGPLLKDLQGDAPLTGRADVFARLNATGADTNAMKNTLSGDTGFTFVDGTVKGIDMLNTLCKAFSGLNVTSLRKEDLIAGLLQFAAPKTTKSSSNQTEFAELKGTLNLSNGLAKNDDLSMKSPLLRVGGKGDINLATERIDYLATVALVSSCQGQGGQDFRELAGIPVPVRISGPITSPKYEPQIGAGVMEALSRSRTQQPAAQAAPTQPQQPVQPTQPKKPEDALKDAGKKAVGDLLRGILK